MIDAWDTPVEWLIGVLVTIKRRQDFRDEATRRQLRWLEISHRDR